MAWLCKADYEYLLASLSEDLDIAKTKRLLYYSLDVNKLLNYNESYFYYVQRGKEVLRSQVKNTINTIYVNSSFSLIYSKHIKACICACCVDDVNLSHIFSLLRLDEFVENHCTHLIVSLQAGVLLAVIGELALVETDLGRHSASNPNDLDGKKPATDNRSSLPESFPLPAEATSDLAENRMKEFGKNNYAFVRKLLKTILLFIIDTGRDRYTYMKESILAPYITPPRPAFRLNPPGRNNGKRGSSADSVEDSNSSNAPPKSDFCHYADILDNDDTKDMYKLSRLLGKHITDLSTGGNKRLADQPYLQSIYNMYQRGDNRLECLLQSGSLLSIYSRLLYLYRSNQYTNTNFVVIKYSIIRQAPRMNRLRQLIFTRLLQSIVRPIWVPSSESSLKGKTSAAQIPPGACENYQQDNCFIELIVDGLLESGVTVWCYENEKEKSDIYNCSALRMQQKVELCNILCIKIDRGFVELPLDRDVPDMEQMADMFTESKGLGGNRINYSGEHDDCSWMLEDTTYTNCRGSRSYYEKVSISDENAYRFLPHHTTINDDSNNILINKYNANRLLGGIPDFCVAGESRFFSTPLVTGITDLNRISKSINSFIGIDDVSRDMQNSSGPGLT